MEDFEIEYEDDDYLSQFIDEEEVKKAERQFIEDQIKEELEEDDTINKDNELLEWFTPDFRQALNESRIKKRELNLPNSKNFTIDHNSFERVKSFRPIAEAASQKTGVPVNLLLGQIYQESRGRNVISPAGAAGVSQFMPATAKQYGVNVNDVVSSIHGQAQYMKDLYNRYQDWDKAIMAYNAGQGRIDNYYKGKGKPLAQETINYLPLVKQAASKFQTGGYAQTGIKYNNLGQPYIEQEQFKVDNSKGYIPTNPQYENVQNLDMSGYGNTMEAQQQSFNNLGTNLVGSVNVPKKFIEAGDDKISSLVDTFSQVNNIKRDMKDFTARTISKGTTLANIALNTQAAKQKRLREQELMNLDLDIYNPNSNNQFKEKTVLG